MVTNRIIHRKSNDNETHGNDLAARSKEKVAIRPRLRNYALVVFDPQRLARPVVTQPIPPKGIDDRHDSVARELDSW